jgi:hypothetical protein
MSRHVTFVLPLLLAAACGHRHHHDPEFHEDDARLVSIEVEVYDPVTNLVWENVLVRVVEAEQEWCGCTYENPNVVWYVTDDTGRVFLDEFILADSQVGFLEDHHGRAILEPFVDENEAVVLLEIDAEGFFPVIVEVPLRWSNPDVFVEVPFD